VSLESASFIGQLQNSNPTPQDPINQGDDHIRLIKKVLQAQFPGTDGSGFSKAITATEDELNYVHGVTSSVQAQLNGSVPIGGIVMWSGAVAPTNWRICDGTNGTPDLRGKFIIGVSSTHALATAGGSEDAVVVAHTHTATSTPNVTGLSTTNDTHSHSITIDQTNTDHSHTFFGVVSGAGSSLGSGGIKLDDSNTGAMSANASHGHSATIANDTHNHDVTGTMTVATAMIAPAGSVVGTGHNLPPFYALAYIQRYQ
jgi:hypothetical protein